MVWLSLLRAPMGAPLLVFNFDYSRIYVILSCLYILASAAVQ
jgi:hypothetical protein